MGTDPSDQRRAKPGTLEEALVCIEELRRELRGAEARFHALVDDLAYGYFTTDLAGTVQSANRLAEVMTGHRAEERPSLVDLIHPEDLPRAASDLALVLTEPNAGPREYRLLRGDGEIRSLEINTVPLRHGDEIVGFQGTARDVTEERRIEAARAESEQRFRDLAELLPGVIYEYDLTGRVTYTNRHALELTGYDAAELDRGVTVLELLEPEKHTQAMANMMRLASGEGPVRGEYQLIRKDGSRLPVEAISSPILRDGQVVGVRGLLHDLSAIRAAEAAKARLEAQVQHAQKLESLGILAGGVAHDFNNLLQVILGNASLALAHAADPAAVAPRLEAIRTAARHARELASQMLAYSGRSPMLAGPLDLNAVVAELRELLAASVPKSVPLTLDLAAEPPWVEGDATQLQQVLLNLVTNAMEAVGDGPGGITIRTGRLEAAPEDLATAHGSETLHRGPAALLEVVDNGSGMDAQTVGRIFDPFFSTKFPGRGLGLAAAFGIVRGHRGVIDVESAPGAGSRFRVLLPLGSPPAPQAEVPPPPAFSAGPTGTILLVDDEEGVRESSGLLLEEAGYRVLPAADGVQAVDVFSAHRAEVSAVLLDLSMPRRDGLQTFQELRRLAPELPIVLCSGYGAEDVSERFRGLSVSAFLKKPYEAVELLRVLRRVADPPPPR